MAKIFSVMNKLLFSLNILTLRQTQGGRKAPVHPEREAAGGRPAQGKWKAPIRPEREAAGGR